MKIHKALNPKGAIAKEMEMGLRRAVHLDHLCELWLLYHKGDHRVASATTPFALPPNIWDKELSKALATAIKGSEIWASAGEAPKSKFRMLKNGPKVTPAPSQKRSWRLLIPWVQIYDHWRSGALERGISDSLKVLPKENRKRIEALRNG